MYSKTKAKAFMKEVRNAIRQFNKTYAEENCPVRLEIYKWNIRSGSALVIGYRTDRPKPDIKFMTMDWVEPNVFMKSNLSDIAYKAYWVD